jgi:hypothetical protein
VSDDGYVSNRKTALADLDKKILAHLRSEASRFERILDAEFRSPKSGRLFGRVANLRRYAAATISGRGYKNGRDKQGQFQSKSPSRRGIKQRSSPGEPPAIQTAALRKGVAHRIERIGAHDWSVVIGVTIQSGRGGPQGKSGRSIADDLEFGTSKMAPRPAWRLALQKWKAEYQEAR